MMHLTAKFKHEKPVTALCFGRYRKISHKFLTTDEKFATCDKCLNLKTLRRTK